MERWKAVSLGVKSLAVANLAAMAGVFLLDVSRPTALKVFLVFRVSAGAVLLLIAVEFLLRRMKGKEYGPIILDVALVGLMFGIWFVIVAATF